MARLLPVVHEEGALLVVEKPAGVDVGGLAEATAPGIIELLAELLPDRAGITPVNRLSRYESGLLLLAWDAGVATRLRSLWKAEGVEQEFVAVVRGRMSKPTMVLGARAEPVRKASRRPIRKPSRPSRLAARDAANGTETVLRRLAQGEQRCLVQCKTRAPTTHALRAQLRSAGLRLLGDRLHDRSPRPSADRETCLHLARVRVALREGQRPVLLQCEPPRAFPAAVAAERDFERPLTAALVRRLPCLVEHNTDCCRLLTGPAEDFPGLVIEKFGDVLIFQLYDAGPKIMQSLRGVADWYRGMLGIKSVYLKPFVKDRLTQNAELEQALRSPRPFFGEPAEERVVVLERGVRFVIRPYDGFSVGLFLDHRDNRSRVRELADGKDVLNLFAYTCGFSVAAALGGAARTVSVDLSARHLDWGKQNFAANHIDLTQHVFFKSDALEFLRRSMRQERRYDLIILDPPSFAHGRRSKGDFSILTDLPDLVSAAADVLRPDGVMMVSTNHRKMSPRDLRQRVTQGLGGRRHEVVAAPSLPPDFAVDRDHAKTLFVRV